MTHTSQSPRTLIITGGFISNHERHVADLRAHANTASAVGKAQSPMDGRRERSTCVSGFPMKATSATRAVAWCSDSKTNISLNFTFPGFTLLENDQKCTFYAILWDDMDPLEIRQAAAK